MNGRVAGTLRRAGRATVRVRQLPAAVVVRQGMALMEGEKTLEVGITRVALGRRTGKGGNGG